MGPLSGLVIAEFEALGPTPFCAMLLADLGASVTRVARTAAPEGDALASGRTTLIADLKTPEGVAAAEALLGRADALLEGYRPGVMERLGLGPDRAHALNPRLTYARMTGWGQTGPLAARAGHDINYIALSGALHAIGPSDRPVPPLNLVGDFGGGALYLAVGVLAGIMDAKRTGKGSVIDCAMVDGVASLMTMIYSLSAQGHWVERREANLLDGGAPFYGTYATKDGKWIAVGAIEPQFYSNLLIALDMQEDIPDQWDRDLWPSRKAKLAAKFATETRDGWDARLLHLDVCYTPVLTMAEALQHPHYRTRDVFRTTGAGPRAVCVPRYSGPISSM